MHHWPSVDLARDLGTPRLTYRRLRVLLTHLPRESAYVQAVGGDIARWGPVEHLLASVIDAVTQLNHNFVQSKTPTKLPKPTLLTRPGIDLVPDGQKLKADVHTMAEMRKILDEWSEPDGN